MEQLDRSFSIWSDLSLHPVAKCKVTAIFAVPAVPPLLPPAGALICAAMEHATLHIQHTLLPSQFEAFNAEFITAKVENFAASLARERWKGKTSESE